MTSLVIGAVNILISISAAIWVFKDAQESGKSKGTALAWSVGTLPLWLIVLPVWLLTKPSTPGLKNENAKFKSKYSGFFFVGVTLSVVFHTGFIYLTPQFSVAKLSTGQNFHK